MSQKTKNSKMGNKKAWSGRFAKKTHSLVDEFNASIGFDWRLYAYDILGSVAHARVLEKAGVLNKKEAARIIKALKEIEGEVSRGKFTPSVELEDVHMAVEKRLIEKIGPLGGKLHTGRSRNDQVALDTRLYLKDEIYLILSLLHDLKKAVVEVAEKNVDAVMPGYTHLQRAQPVLLAHHMLAYYEMLKRDTERLLDCLERTDSMPLGSGALAGSPYRLERRLAARLLGFSSITENSLDGVSDRDFVVEFLSCASILMMHLSRLSEELILWSSQEFSFVELSDAFSTGSSIMPQKKNPDVAELTRGKTGRVYGNLVSMLTTMKALPLAYNKDMQEDKEPLFDTVDTLKAVLKIYPPMLLTMEVRKEAMKGAVARGFLTATDAADYLAVKGVAFRDAHNIAGRIVAYCIRKGKTLEEMDTEEWKKFSEHFGPDIREAVSIRTSIKSRAVHGGTAPANVKRRLRKVKAELERGAS